MLHTEPNIVRTFFEALHMRLLLEKRNKNQRNENKCQKILKMNSINQFLPKSILESSATLHQNSLALGLALALSLVLESYWTEQLNCPRLEIKLSSLWQMKPCSLWSIKLSNKGFRSLISIDVVPLLYRSTRYFIDRKFAYFSTLERLIFNKKKT